MKPENANLINGLSLTLFGIWGYFESLSITAFIPVLFGAILLSCYYGIKNNNKIIAHIVVVLTFLILFALVFKRLPNAYSSGGMGLFRSIAMIFTSIFALIFFIKNFIDNRKVKKINNE
tara:strand:+ start:444 stop:800 length:357 start_codon:yes stop_codon:yes gene_type:complete